MGITQDKGKHSIYAKQNKEPLGRLYNKYETKKMKEKSRFPEITSGNEISQKLPTVLPTL